MFPASLLSLAVMPVRPAIPPPTETEARMRRYLGLGVAGVIVALGIVLWAKSSVVETNADVVRSSVGISPYEIMTNSKDLPVEHVENPM
jgi:hypothetical protein